MKPPYLLIFVAAFSALCCKKSTDNSNITLYGKTPGIIKMFIQGKWKVHYAKGGLNGNTITHFDDFIMEFKFAAIDSQFAGTSAGYTQSTLIEHPAFAITRELKKKGCSKLNSPYKI